MITLSFTVPEQHPCFPAHFPGQAIVPGALLMQWIFAHICSQYRDHAIIAIKSMKFLNSLQPGDACRLELESDANLQRLNLSCYRDSDLICKGAVELAPQEAQ